MLLNWRAGAVRGCVQQSKCSSISQRSHFSCSHHRQPFFFREKGRSLATLGAASVEEAPTTQEQAPQKVQDKGSDDDFPEESPDDLENLVQKEKYAVIEIGGVQMFVQEGRWYNCNRLEAEPGQTIQLGRVLAVKDKGKFNVGQPYLEQATVKAEIVEDLKGPKLTIFKMNRKKHYRRKTGHRQPLTQFYIKEITV